MSSFTTPTTACPAPPGDVPRYRDSGLSRSPVAHELRPDGTILLRALDAPVQVAAVGMSGFVPRWAAERPAQPAFSERDAGGGWSTLSWGEFHAQMLVVAAGLLEWGLSQQRPLMILSGNSLEQAVLIAAAEYVGIASVPVSPAYSLQSQDFGRLRAIHALVQPAAVFVQSAEVFAKALQALGTPAAKVLAVAGTGAEQSWRSLNESTLTPARMLSVQAAHAAIRPDEDIARIFFTSGSTGAPKGVPITYDNVAAHCGQLLYSERRMVDAPLVMLDWLPWSHLFGGLSSLCRCCALGGSYYIDDGRPIPSHFTRTLQNLTEIAPTLYVNVPAAWVQLSIALERDEALARHFFSRLRFAGYGGASLPRDTWERVQAAAVRTMGERIVFMSGFGATETSGSGMTFNRPCDDVGNIGTPTPGVEVKLIPLEGGDERYEVRMRGRQIFPGYLKRPDLTKAAMDDEGYYALGDAVRLVNPASPEDGLRYAGRCVEDFKLDSGTWVRTGSVRLALIEQCAPLLADAVICGHDRAYVAALAWPNIAECQRLAPELSQLQGDALVAHPLVVDALTLKLRQFAAVAASQQVRRVLLLAEPPSADAGEIADKGSINQAAARQRRAEWIVPLFAEPAGPAVADIG